MPFVRFFTIALTFAIFGSLAASAAPLNTAKLLYRVSSENGDSYILGTVHVGVALNEFPPSVTDLITKSRVLLPELAITLEDSLAYTSDPLGVLQRYANLEPPYAEPQVIEQIIRMGIPASIAKTFGDDDCSNLGVIGYLGRSSLDLDVIRTARLSKVEVIALDTPPLRKQAAAAAKDYYGECSLKILFRSFTIPQLRASILDSVERAIAEYRNGEAVSKVDMNDPLTVVRNLAWMPTVLAEVQKGKAFVAVGQAHLHGPQGLIELLRAEGYTANEVVF